MRLAAATLVLGMVAACASGPSPPLSADPTRSASPPATVPSSSSPADRQPEPPPAEAEPAAPSASFDPRVAVRTVRHLAGGIGPREATTAAYRRAAAWVARRLAASGYDVRTEPFDVPGGVSWGVPVPPGRSLNLVAALPNFDPGRPYLLVGAHLDTVPQAPGAEDNASGVGVLLAVAGATAGRRTRLPVAFVAFGAEEPRGPGDDDHHFGSRHHVARMGPRERASLRGMVSLDRVGVGTSVPVCTAGGPDPLRTEVLRAARRARISARPCVNRSSDHWSFVRGGLPGVRIGGTPYAAYHSAADRPGGVDPAQRGRVGRLVLAWLAG